MGSNRSSQTEDQLRGKLDGQQWGHPGIEVKIEVLQIISVLAAYSYYHMIIRANLLSPSGCAWTHLRFIKAHETYYHPLLSMFSR